MLRLQLLSILYLYHFQVVSCFTILYSIECCREFFDVFVLFYTELDLTHWPAIWPYHRCFLLDIAQHSAKTQSFDEADGLPTVQEVWAG
jgi:hypothetical protein